MSDTKNAPAPERAEVEQAAAQISKLTEVLNRPGADVRDFARTLAEDPALFRRLPLAVRDRMLLRLFDRLKRAPVDVIDAELDNALAMEEWKRITSADP